MCRGYGVSCEYRWIGNQGIGVRREPPLFTREKFAIQMEKNKVLSIVDLLSSIFSETAGLFWRQWIFTTNAGWRARRACENFWTHDLPRWQLLFWPRSNYSTALPYGCSGLEVLSTFVSKCSSKRNRLSIRRVWLVTLFVNARVYLLRGCQVVGWFTLTSEWSYRISYVGVRFVVDTGEV